MKRPSVEEIVKLYGIELGRKNTDKRIWSAYKMPLVDDGGSRVGFYEPTVPALPDL